MTEQNEKNSASETKKPEFASWLLGNAGIVEAVKKLNEIPHCPSPGILIQHLTINITVPLPELRTVIPPATLKKTENPANTNGEPMTE